MGSFTETLMEKEEDSLNSRKKPMKVKLNSEQLDNFIQIFLNMESFFA
ncbi:hypothetical protein QFZ73_004011 [Peribacillus sp. V2I11]|nr:hypothetical protein [Peribacillus sp. V2I11]